MSPSLSPEARGAGQRIHDSTQKAGWKSWHCFRLRQDRPRGRLHRDPGRVRAALRDLASERGQVVTIEPVAGTSTPGPRIPGQGVPMTGASFPAERCDLRPRHDPTQE